MLGNGGTFSLTGFFKQHQAADCMPSLFSMAQLIDTNAGRPFCTSVTSPDVLDIKASIVDELLSKEGLWEVSNHWIGLLAYLHVVTLTQDSAGNLWDQGLRRHLDRWWTTAMKRQKQVMILFMCMCLRVGGWVGVSAVLWHGEGKGRHHTEHVDALNCLMRMAVHVMHHLDMCVHVV